MVICFDTALLEHIENMSYYNHNYYKLPYSIDNCDVAYSVFDELCNCNDWYLGVIENGVFISKMCFSSNDPNENTVDLIKNRIV